MTGRISGVMAAAMLAGVVPAAAPGAGAAQAAPVDWTRTIATTPAGAHVIGNPRAKVKLVEYLSLTCSHCAAFAAEGMPALRRDYIARGTVSLEVRNAVRDGYDMAGVLASRCAGPAGYFAVSERILATQAQWMPRAQAHAAAQAGKPAPASEAAAIAGMAGAAGFDQLLRARGMTPVRVRACFSDPKQTAVATAMAQEAFGRANIPGTPAFFLNGVLVPDSSSWALLKPKLDAALR